MISTSDNFKYEWINAPRNRAAIVLELRSSGPAHIGLSDTRHATDRMYQLVIGDSSNSMSWIGRGKHGKLLLKLQHLGNSKVINCRLRDSAGEREKSGCSVRGPLANILVDLGEKYYNIRQGCYLT